MMKLNYKKVALSIGIISSILSVIYFVSDKHSPSVFSEYNYGVQYHYLNGQDPEVMANKIRDYCDESLARKQSALMKKVDEDAELSKKSLKGFFGPNGPTLDEVIADKYKKAETEWAARRPYEYDDCVRSYNKLAEVIWNGYPLIDKLYGGVPAVIIWIIGYLIIPAASGFFIAYYGIIYTVLYGMPFSKNILKKYFNWLKD